MFEVGFAFNFIKYSRKTTTETTMSKKKKMKTRDRTFDATKTAHT